ncbi:nuclear transport factor 2 family protein [Sinimarinibacterium sp. CAU 1509]|uniref:nuclear transport factor 2 family protein n=1 Tax=Sinimarinibacterium sp. CAU 1509 TaxID=2562283 RepID=UPI0010AD67AE|nr:nuclear transport factor 2 family protein [Sinimarinibacterium sp. CAU 1509]TJY59924.1 nuclear transport factor 2 family protein [Sinimarinibacterium sp. CAU 1509]
MRRSLMLSLALLTLGIWQSATGQTSPTFADMSAVTQRAAEAYFSAYIARDWDALAPHLADSGSFTDPTAEPVFGLVAVSGKIATLKYFRQNYAAIKAMQFNRTRAYFSGAHAVFEGTLDWTLTLDSGKDVETRGMPFVTILRLDGDQVVDHRDFADYQPFIEAYRQVNVVEPSSDGETDPADR